MGKAEPVPGGFGFFVLGLLVRVLY